MATKPELSFARRKWWEGVGKLRRLLLSELYPKWVARSIRSRKGECTRCGNCCKLLYECPFLQDGNRCRIYGKRIKNCSNFPIDSRDVEHIDCGHFFPVAAKVDDGMPIPVSRYAYREILTFLGGCAIGLSGAAALIYFISPLAGIIPGAFFLLICGFALWFFRDPNRSVPEDPDALVSPADGKVVAIDEVDEPEFIGGKALRIGIFLSIFNCHVNRTPCPGVVKFLKYKPGRFINAMSAKSSLHNESNLVGIEGTETAPSRVLVKQIAGAIAKRIVCDLELDESVENGQKFGIIKFGSRTELYVPLQEGYEPAVELNRRVKGGATILMRRKQA